MAAAPRISVVIPTFNRAGLVGEAIGSVLAQTLSDFELLVVDDGSTDDTEQVVRGIQGSDPRLGYHRKENGGTADARQYGLDRARGEWIALLDSDDLYLPRFLESQFAWLEARPGADLVICDARYEGPWEHDFPTVFRHEGWRTPDSIEALVAGAWSQPSTMMMRTQIARSLGFRSPYPFAEDQDFLWRFVIAGHALIENREVLGIYRRHSHDQKIDRTGRYETDQTRVLRRYARHAPHPRRFLRDLCRMHARLLLAEGRWRAARPYLWSWVRAKPHSTKAWRFALQSLVRHDGKPVRLDP